MTMGLQVLYSRLSAAVLAVLVVWLSIQCAAQQTYNSGSGYVCNNPTQKPCDTFVLYRAQGSYSSIQTIASLFQANQTQVATINKMPEDAKLWSGDALIVPITCVCNDTQTTYANVTYTIAMGDTFDKIAKVTFESLASSVAIQNANPGTTATLLFPLENLVVPVNCACPSTTQQIDSVSALVTYPVVIGDSVTKVSSEFGVPRSTIYTANELTANDVIFAQNSTLLIPITTSPPTFTTMGNSAPASGFSTGAYMTIALAGLSVLVTGMVF